MEAVAGHGIRAGGRIEKTRITKGDDGGSKPQLEWVWITVAAWERIHIICSVLLNYV